METEKSRNVNKFKKWGCWVSTILLSLGMLAGGISQIFQAKANADGMIQLSYPLYFMTILGTWKILGVIVLLIPGYTLVKEWAYAGFFFAMSGAVISHIVTGDGVEKWIPPFIFMLLTIASWKLRPENKKIKTAQIVSKS